MPNISGEITFAGNGGNGAFLSPGYTNGAFGSGELTFTGASALSNGAQGHSASFNASRSSNIYGASTTVQPAAISLIPQIKI